MPAEQVHRGRHPTLGSDMRRVPLRVVSRSSPTNTLRWSGDTCTTWGSILSLRGTSCPAAFSRAALPCRAAWTCGAPTATTSAPRPAAERARALMMVSFFTRPTFQRTCIEFSRRTLSMPYSHELVHKMMRGTEVIAEACTGADPVSRISRRRLVMNDRMC